MNVPFFNYQHIFKSKEDKLLEIIKDVGNRGAFILQKDLEEFEKNLAEYVGVKYAVGVANGTDAIWLALLAAGIGRGDEVILFGGNDQNGISIESIAKILNTINYEVICMVNKRVPHVYIKNNKQIKTRDFLLV